MALVVLRSGDGLTPWLLCDCCQQPTILAQSWVGFAPLAEGVESSEGMIAHRRCLDGSAMPRFGVDRLVHWRAYDFFVKLFAPTGIANPALPRMKDPGAWAR